MSKFWSSIKFAPFLSSAISSVILNNYTQRPLPWPKYRITLRLNKAKKEACAFIVHDWYIINTTHEIVSISKRCFIIGSHEVMNLCDRVILFHFTKSWFCVIVQYIHRIALVLESRFGNAARPMQSIGSFIFHWFDKLPDSVIGFLIGHQNGRTISSYHSIYSYNRYTNH